MSHPRVPCTHIYLNITLLIYVLLLTFLMRQIEAVIAELAILSIFELERIDILTRRSSHKDISIRSVLFDSAFSKIGMDFKKLPRTHQLLRHKNERDYKYRKYHGLKSYFILIGGEFGPYSVER